MKKREINSLCFCDKRKKREINSSSFWNKSKKRGQIGIEYMIIVGFVTFAVISILTMAVFYSDQIKDKIKTNQAENFAIQLINSAESVFFAGEPSKVTVNLYLPEGIDSVQIDSTSNYVIITQQVSSGENKNAYKSRVPIQGTISATQGIRRLTLEAFDDYLLIS